MFFERNICQFVPQGGGGYTLTPLHFVLETNPKEQTTETLSVFRVAYLLKGQGSLTTSKGEFSLSEGSVFFCLPAKKHTLKTQKGTVYSYISYFGAKGNQLAEMIKLSESNCVFNGISSIKMLWSNALPAPNEVTGIRAESVLLYTFSAIWEKLHQDRPTEHDIDAATEAKKYIDTHFSDPDLTLPKVCAATSYSTKYTSALFSKRYGVGFSSYVNSVRIQHACSLFEKGHTSIKTVAFMCGFFDPLYFSKTFKAFKGLSPKGYIKDYFEKNNANKINV